MDNTHDSFWKANYLLRKADYDRWHRQQSKQYILRSQLGFTDLAPSRPQVCQGCEHYHGIAYSYRKETRAVLICGFHPYGWQGEVCPDWSGIASS